MSDFISDPIHEEEKKPLDPPEHHVEEPGDPTDAHFVPYRVFMNQVDAFNAKYIASLLADQFYGEKQAPGTGNVTPLLGEEEAVPEEIIKHTEDARNKYEIIGTLSSTIRVKTEDILYVVTEDSTKISEEITNSGIIIYDITRTSGEIPKAINALKLLLGQLDELKKIGPKTYANSARNYVFVLISTVMTWANTKTKILEEPGPFTEAHYRKRKPHPDYKEHLECERQVTALGRKHKSKLKTYVLASGFTYGYEEGSMDFLFKAAWLNNQHLPIFGDGMNRVPLIHVSDLAKIIVYIVMNHPSQRYIIAVEPVSTKWRKIVKTISKHLGRGYVKEVTLQEALEFPGVSEANYTQFTVNLNMEPAFILETSIQFDYQTGFLENAARLAEELKEMRELNPIKIIIHGPPCAGKTRLAKRICDEYGLHYVSIKTMIEETLQSLRDNITEEKARLKAKQERDEQKALTEVVDEESEEGEDDEEVEEEEEEAGGIEEWEEQIRDIQVMLSESENNKLPDDQVTRLLKTFLESNLCQNQGFVLDGYPKSIAQAQDLFSSLPEGEDEEMAGEGLEDDENMIEAMMDSKIMPHYVFSLRAPDEFLCNRIKKLLERDLEGTHYTEEHMLRRLEEFRELNNEDDTVLNFFDEMEVHPVLIDVTKDETENMDEIFEAVRLILGEPINFGLSTEEILEAQRQAGELKKFAELEAEELKQLEEKAAVASFKEKLGRWAEASEKIQEEEEKIFVAEGESLRTYMMEFIFPTLTKALIEVAKCKPDDPVDFLAEYLFRINPEAQIFDPTFNQKGQNLLDLCNEALTTATSL